MPLNLQELRHANIKRLPQFKNKKGGLAHNKEDGSDWTPARWIQALIGEVGEFARARLDFEDGKVTYEKYQEEAPKELADTQTYLDILAWRALDQTDDIVDSATMLMAVVAALGEYANDRKKFERGDYTADEYFPIMRKNAAALVDSVQHMVAYAHDVTVHQQVLIPHTRGVDLGKATILKFNEVSKRVGCDVQLHHTGGVLERSVSHDLSPAIQVPAAIPAKMVAHVPLEVPPMKLRASEVPAEGEA